LALDTDSGYAVHMQSAVLSRAEAVQRLSAHEDEIRALGVIRLALFGSVLRGQTHADSDVDVLVQFASGAKTYDRFLALSELLERCLSRRVELVTAEALSHEISSVADQMARRTQYVTRYLLSPV